MSTTLSKPQKHTMFAPVKFGSVTSRNRIVMAPMVTNFATPKNEVTDRQIAYYAERARGGVGTIVVEASVIHQAVLAFERQVGVYDDRLLPGLSRLARAIQEEGAVALIQLHHAGPRINSELGLQPVSVSPVLIREGSMPRQLSSEALRQVRSDFVTAAHRACRAGFDGIELHAAHMYMLSASISPYTNRRNDAYGGDVHNRARLTREIISDIRANLGADYPVWVRINGYESLDPGLSVEESQKIAAIFAEAGADVIHVSAFTNPIDKNVDTKSSLPVRVGLSKDGPPGAYLDYAKAVKEAINIPVVAVGKLDDPSLAAKSLSDGKCDLVALARQFLCDPYWVLKVQEDREKEIVHCNYCETCHRALYKSVDIHCSQNLNLYGAPSHKPAS